MQKYYQGRLPSPNDFSEKDREVQEALKQASKDISQSLEKFKFRDALAKYMGLARMGNKYLADEEPWKKFKNDPERTKTILYIATQVCAVLSQLGEPFMPFTSAKLRSFLNMELLPWDNVSTSDLIPPGAEIEKAALLFGMVEDEKVEEQLNKLKPVEKLEEKLISHPLKKEIGFEDFQKMDIRTGTILEAEIVPKTDKLLKLLVDIGLEKRTIVSGIAQHFKPEELIGKQVSVLANLAAKKLRGVESKGMILMAEDQDGKLSFVAPVNQVSNGSGVS